MGPGDVGEEIVRNERWAGSMSEQRVVAPRALGLGATTNSLHRDAHSSAAQGRAICQSTEAHNTWW